MIKRVQSYAIILAMTPLTGQGRHGSPLGRRSDGSHRDSRDVAGRRRRGEHEGEGRERRDDREGEGPHGH